MSDIFISYSREEQAQARVFADAFEREGYSVWWDVTLRSGEAFDEAIERVLREAKAVVVLWSKKSVTSRWVRAEATLADRNKTLLPVIIEPCDRPMMFELAHAIDLTGWSGDSAHVRWLALLDDVRHFVGRLTEPEPAAVSEAMQVAAKPDGRPSVLVLPFINMSGDPEQEYFSDGVTEDIIIDLFRRPYLSVVARNTAFAYKGRTLAAPKLGQELQCSHILEGTVRKSGNRIRITAQLSSAAADKQIWAERYDRNLDDIFTIQDEISKAIVEALSIRLGLERSRAPESPPTSSGEAYELYLMARQFHSGQQERHYALIVRLCRRAVELDPGYARAFALMSIAQADVRRLFGSRENGREAAERAIELDPTLAEGHAGLGRALFDEGSHEASLEACLRALHIDPFCEQALTQAGYACLALDRPLDAIRYYEGAIAAEPGDLRAVGMVVQAYRDARQTENNQAAARRLLSLVERILAETPDHGHALGFGVTALAQLRDAQRAKDWARRALMVDPDNILLRHNIACSMIALGEFDMAFSLLENQVMNYSEGLLIWMGRDSDFDAVRDHPTFLSILAKAHTKIAATTSK
ncbi:MAG TPA: TIR domain-containing protein [Steroidobacteraceae bacterium]|jgi:adenylate cyclase